MLTKLEKAIDTWGGSSKIVDQWLDNRRQLLINYCQLAGLPPYSNDTGTLPEEAHIKHFCGLLMDYVSAGHFEVYDQVASACEKSGEKSRQLAKELLPKINLSTDLALDFNDQYTNGIDDEQMLRLDQDLSKLGQAMEERFELEDRLLDTLHQGLETTAT
ncbi:sigma D regulator [Ferrimonas lipolytica]|uniref:Sigma D regulator n=1 Tax=Ferrimonas lipolytica TaxID=2724191 RepID=A0A6H1UL88_9GAMM|nr:sigma D regulator [Ferrimonas lipolytica]QIZ78562.1 sigma D regulator [Ferrimonas lipolytica]